MGIAVAISWGGLTPMAVLWCGVPRLWGWRHLLRNGPLDDLVKFSPVKPDTATFRAVIDFDPLTFGHDQIDGTADWTFHDVTS